MKRFYFTERKDCKNKSDRTLRIYAIESGSLKYVTETTHRPGCGSRGATSEAFNALIDCGAIPEKYRGDGYFYGNGTDVTAHYAITEIY